MPVSTFLFLFSTLFYLFVQRIQEKLRSGKLSVSDDQWPIFLYRFYKFDSSDPWKGLLQSSILVKVSHIFLIKIISSFSFLIKDIQAYFYFPSSVEREAKSTRFGNAHIHGITEATPASIAYAATQVCDISFALFFQKPT